MSNTKKSVAKVESPAANVRKPVAKVSLYPITAAIWRNEGPKGEIHYNVTFERSYRDDAGGWKSSDSFNASDLLLLAKVADRAHSAIYNLRATDRQNEQQIDE